MKYDAIIIGTGQSGPPLAKKFCEKGYKVAIIERGRFGGTCVNTGCTPTKTLYAHAKVAQTVRQSSFFGVNVDHFDIDYKTIKARKDAIVQEWSQGVEKSLKSADGCTVIKGQARFEGPHQVRVGDQLLEASQLFINVGARSAIPPIPGLQQIPFFTNASLLEINSIPEHLMILGGGYIGLEFAQIFRRFGSRVTVIQRSPFVMPKEDQDVSQTIQEFLEKEGIQIHTQAINFQILSGSSEGKIFAQFEKNGSVKNISSSHLLVAAGRVPNTDDLGLDKAGIKVSEKGYIEVDDQLRTVQPHIWALGDCNGKGAFTHTSYYDYEIVAANLFDNDSRKVSDRIPIYALFTDPPLGRVGLTEKEALNLHQEVWMAKIPMNSVSRAIEKGETEGFLKILVDPKTKLILGASFLGTSCDEVIQTIAALMYAKAPYPMIQRMMPIHPTISEFIPSLLAKLHPIG